MDRSASFLRVLNCLPDLHTLAYDRRGYGRSRAVEPAAASLGVHVTDLFGIVAGRPAVVVGHSYGGDVAMAASIERPDLVRSVVVYEAPTPWVPWWPTDSAGGRATQFPGNPADAAEAFFRRLVGDDVWERLPRRTREARRAEGPAVLGDLTSIRSAAPFEIAAVPVPVVVGSGTASAAHHKECAHRMAAELPDAELVVINGAGHNAQATHPQQFAALVRQGVERASF